MPMKEILEPSVPPRIGSQIGVIPAFFHSDFSYVNAFHIVFNDIVHVVILIF